MALAIHFYHSTTRKYIAIFGSIFNKLSIERQDANEIQRMPIPVQYGPYQKWLSRLVQDKNLDKKTGISMPRISFEISGMTYDSQRNLPSLNKLKGSGKSLFMPSAWNIDFTVSVMTMYHEDAVQIVEQIIPFFKPSYSVSAKMIDDFEPVDIHINLTSVTSDDIYDGNYEVRQSIIWTLTFTMKAWYFGPVKTPKVIKFIDVDIKNSEAADSRVITRPGLTAAGEPTTNVKDSIPWQSITEDDDWGLIQIIEEELE